MTPLRQVASAVADSSGAATWTLGPVSPGYAWSGTLSLHAPGAATPGAARSSATVGGVVWMSWYGSGPAGPVQAQGSETISVTTSGLIAGTLYTLSLIGEISTQSAAPPVSPAAVTTSTSITSGTVNITGSVDVTGGTLGVTNSSYASSLAVNGHPGPIDFGSGGDGDVTISADTTLARDMNYNSLTIDSGVTLTTAGWIVRVKGTLTNNGTIDNSASEATPGAGASLGAGAPGVSSSDSNGLPPPNANYQGGAGGSNPGSSLTGGAVVLSPLSLQGIFTLDFTMSGGASGSQYNGLKSGAGGGAIYVAATEISGSGTFSAIGGDAVTNGAEAAGGGGGAIILVCNTYTFTGAINVAGGTGDGTTASVGKTGRIAILEML